MRKAFGTVSVAAIVAHEASARGNLRNSSPFVGEHKDARTIEHGNGRVTNKMHPVKTSYNKYASFIERENLFTNRTTADKEPKQSLFSELLFGKQEPAKHHLGASLSPYL